MISFNSLGNLGRLANQMFQYASIKGIANNCGLEFALPPENAFGTRDPMVRNSDTNLYQTFKLPSFKQEMCAHPQYVEENFAFIPELFTRCPDNIDLVGYFQTEKYFKHIQYEIRKDFTFIDEVSEPCKNIWKSIFGGADVLSLHVRRGDYVGHTAHPVQSMEYYKTALSYFSPDQPVLLCSDDPDWCREEFKEDRFMISTSGDTRVDLCLMTMCKYHIIANSSYSWWGAWLANSEKVIAPDKWFTGELAHKDTTDIYCPGWITI